MAKYKAFENWLKSNSYESWKTYLSYINTIDKTLNVADFENINSVQKLNELFQLLKENSEFLVRSDSDKSNILSGFRTYIDFIQEAFTTKQMRVWRVGSNWGGINILPVFREHNMAYAGKEVEGNLLKINIGDIVAVTSGQSIVAVGKATGLEDLSSFNPMYASEYEDVKAIKLSPFYFKGDFPSKDFGIYDGQGKQFHEAHGNYATQIISLFNQLNAKQMHEKIKSILKYKKQIILQGPPGTGKTKVAKEVARELVRPMAITIEDIKRSISVGQTVTSKYDKIPYLVDSINDVGISLRLKNGSLQTRNYNHILQAYTNLIERKPIGDGETYQAAIANYIYENSKGDGQYKVIQFHPSFTYEDFVRGIVAESKGDKIEYKNVNKVLGQFAKDAYENYGLSKEDNSDIQQEKWARDSFNDFKEEIEKEIEQNEVILSGKIGIFEVDNSCFRYGKEWGVPSRLNFTDFRKLVKAVLIGSIKLTQTHIPKAISPHAHYRSTYYLALLRIFFGKYQYSKSIDRPTLRNYVLIIDEINRANLSSVLGELIYAMEYRDEKIESMYAIDDKYELVLPPNLYIIGTMNTADRSVGHIDYAIRRRFAFVEVMPKDLSSDANVIFHKSLFDKVASIFDTNLSPEFEKKDVQLGHSYFIDKTKEGGSMDIRLDFEIKPILREYVKDGILTGDNIKEVIDNLQA